MPFVFINETLRLNNFWLLRKAINVIILVFVICIEVVIYLSLYNLLDCTFKFQNLDWTFYVTWINLLLMKHKLKSFDWIANNLIVRNLLVNYLNLVKESIQKQLLTEQMFFETGVLKNFAIFRGKHLWWGLSLMKCQDWNFPENNSNFFRTAFFLKQLRWLILKNS